VRRTVPLLRGIPILIVILAAAVAGMAWAISSPIGSSPDEDFHVASIWCPPPAETSGCEVKIAPRGYKTVTVVARVAAACYSHNPDQSGACIWTIPADKLYDDYAFNQGGYPPVFYHVLHIFAFGDPYRSIYLIRAFNVALAIVLGALLVVGATRPTRRILAYVIVGTYVPMGMFIVPSANPSSWALIGVTTAAFAFHSYWISERRSMVIFNGVLAAVGVGLAASARADAALYSVLAAVAVTFLHYRSVRRHLVRLVLPSAVAIGGFVAFRMSSQGADALAGGLGSSASSASANTGGLHLLLSNILEIPMLVLGNQGVPGLGSLGQLDTPMPRLVYVATVMVCAFLVMAGVGRLSWMKSLVSAGGFLVFCGIPLYILQTSHLAVGDGVQPRYLLPLMPVVFLVLLTGSRPEQAVRLSRAAAWLAWALASIANSVALMVNIQRYTTGMDGPLFPGHAVEWWSTNRVGPLPTWILGSLGFAIAAWMVVRLSSGPDAPALVASSADHTAIAPAPVSTTERALTRTPQAADVEPIPVEPPAPQPVASRPATPEYIPPGPASSGITSP
jgi:Predicted membrane protein (DUF2142)